MTTMVGTQKSFTEAVKKLVELDYDAIEAYDVVIDNIENPVYKKNFKKFKADHKRHITELGAFLSRCNEVCPSGPDNTKSLLAIGRVELASLFGDRNIMNALLANEEDANDAYERMNARISDSSDAQIAQIIAQGLEDARKHKDWLKTNIYKSSIQEEMK